MYQGEIKMGRLEGKIPDKTCDKCGGKYKYEKKHICPQNIPAPENKKADDIEMTTTSRSFEDIENDLNKAEVKDNKIPIGSSTAPQAGTTDKSSTHTVTIDPRDVILFKDMFGAISETLNKKYNCTDFPTDSDRLARLERMTVATLEYYKVHFTPPIALVLTLGAVYGIPMLKHIGILDKIKEKLSNKDKDKDKDKNHPEAASVKFPFQKLPAELQNCEKCKKPNMLIMLPNGDAIAQCSDINCNTVKKVN
jgi:hypothetical protein